MREGEEENNEIGSEFLRFHHLFSSSRLFVQSKRRRSAYSWRTYIFLVCFLIARSCRPISFFSSRKERKENACNLKSISDFIRFLSSFFHVSFLFLKKKRRKKDTTSRRSSDRDIGKWSVSFRLSSSSEEE